MEIAPNFTEHQWKVLTFRGKQDWVVGIAALRRRLEQRFIKPAHGLLRFKKSGFAILALDCLLVETLEQFREGVGKTPYVKRGGRRFLASEDYFVAFLTSAYFGPGFDPNTAKLFYKTIRCGILHQAEVEASSLVRRSGPVVKLSSDGRGIVVNPVEFHKRIEAAFNRYLVNLRSGVDPALRQNFRTKMDYIARV